MRDDDLPVCPGCGALVSLRLARCRRCDRYLHGTWLEGALVALLPEAWQAYPGTGSLVMMIALAYLAMGVIAGPREMLAFSSYTLAQLGALHGPALYEGEWWRLVAYMFGHHDLVHVAFNITALVTAGAAVEELFDRKKMFLMYLAAGLAGGVFAVGWYVWPFAKAATTVCAGASGAVSGMIGAALVGARRRKIERAEMASAMGRWSVQLLVFSLLPGVSLAAHLGGYLMGAALAAVVPLGPTAMGARRTVMSELSLAGIAAVLASLALTGRAAWGFPTRLERDGESRGILSLTIFPGERWDASDQVRLATECVSLAESEAPQRDEALRVCRVATRAAPSYAPAHMARAELLRRHGRYAEAARVDRLVEALLPRENP